MKIALINGQNHKGSTYHIGRMLADKLTTPENITEIFLPRDLPQFCCGCAQCIVKDEALCPHYKQLHPLTQIIDEADVLILTSPVYVYHVTGSMKAFLDHYGYRWMVHRPEATMFKKQAVVISTAAGGGMKSACRDMADSCYYWGIAKIYSYGIAVSSLSWENVSSKKKAVINKKTDRLAAMVKYNDGRIKPGIKTQCFFGIMRIVQKKGSTPVDATYWNNMGWTQKERPW